MTEASGPKLEPSLNTSRAKPLRNGILKATAAPGRLWPFGRACGVGTITHGIPTTMPLAALTLPLVLAAFAAAPGPQQPVQKLYVANSAGNDLHVIDTATNRVIKRVEVGPEPHGLVATANGDRVFITIENTKGDAGELLWFDPVTDTVTRRMTIGPRPTSSRARPMGRSPMSPATMPRGGSSTR